MKTRRIRTILFQGDSITDCGRVRDLQDEENNLKAMGLGYPKFIGAKLLTDYPTHEYSFYNRGISGNRVVDLYARWKVDCLNIKPDLVSILVGVNDTWHDKDSSNGVEPDRYEVMYRMLLEWTQWVLPETIIVLCEPFVLNCGVVREGWIPEMDARRMIVRSLAKDFNCPFIPFQSMFNEVSTTAPAEFWAQDGVHPSLAGHNKMAEFWLEHIKLDQDDSFI